MTLARMGSAEAIGLSEHTDQMFGTMVQQHVKSGAHEILHWRALSKRESSIDEENHAVELVYDGVHGEGEQQRVEQERG